MVQHAQFFVTSTIMGKVPYMTFDGTWKCMLKTPMGPEQLSITLQSQGDGLMGTVSGKGMDTPIESGRSNGDSATWKAKVKKPMAVTLDFNVTLSGNELKGTVKFGVFGSGALTGIRADGTEV